jgi:citrate lyase subunit beta-like protein
MIDCADLGLTRTPGRTELLYPRSKLVTTAKAFGLQAIDLVRPLIDGVDGRYV